MSKQKNGFDDSDVPEIDLSAAMAKMQAEIDELRNARSSPVIPPRTIPAIPPREPEGIAEWEVCVRHSPLPNPCKRLIVTASGPEDAWAKYLDEVEPKLTTALFAREMQTSGAPETPAERMHMTKQHRASALEYLGKCRKQRPEGVSILGAKYVAERLRALRAKGTVSIEQVGFPELASI